MNSTQLTFYYLSVALAIGLLIGVERGWKQRKSAEGDRVAGVRTYGLVGLLGGVSALLAETLGALVLGLAFLGVSAVFILAHRADLEAGAKDVGITSLIAGLLTFGLGALAGLGEVAVAVASAVLVTVLLSYKPVLHRWIRILERYELRAGLKLLLISVVILPILPDKGFGPWQSLNPYVIWWMVVLISGISFVGYFATKFGGARWGAALTGLFAGLASSTALTLHFSKLARDKASIAPALSTGILLACGTMFFRFTLLASVINPQLLQLVSIPALAMLLVSYSPALVYWYRQPNTSATDEPPIKNPLALPMALGFGVLLAVVLLLVSALNHWFGDRGVLALAAISGISDVDPITLSLARMSDAELTSRIAAVGIIIAAAVNSMVKGLLSGLIGGKALALRVGLPLFVAGLTGLAAAWLWVW